MTVTVIGQWGINTAAPPGNNAIFECGFEEGSLGTHWSLRAGTASISNSSPLNGTYSLLANPTASDGNLQTVSTYGAGFLIYRYHVRFDNLPTQHTELDGPLAQWGGARFNVTDSKIYASCNNNYGATGVAVTTGVTYLIDVRTDFTANPWVVDVKVNGSDCGQASSGVAADTNASSVMLGLNPGAAITCTARFDDFLLSITPGDWPLGEGTSTG